MPSSGSRFTAFRAFHWKAKNKSEPRLSSDNSFWSLLLNLLKQNLDPNVISYAGQSPSILKELQHFQPAQRPPQILCSKEQTTEYLIWCFTSKELKINAKSTLIYQTEKLLPDHQVAATFFKPWTESTCSHRVKGAATTHNRLFFPPLPCVDALTQPSCSDRHIFRQPPEGIKGCFYKFSYCRGYVLVGNITFMRDSEKTGQTPDWEEKGRKQPTDFLGSRTIMGTHFVSVSWALEGSCTLPAPCKNPTLPSQDRLKFIPGTSNHRV